MNKNMKTNNESGNVLVIVLVALAIVAVGVLAYLSGQSKKEERMQTAAANGQVAAPQDADAGEQMVIKPGNPVVAKVDGQEITRVDVFNFIQTLPAQTRQLPVAQLFPVALDQVINGRIIEENTKGVRLDSDPVVKERLANVKKTIVREVYVQKQVEKKLTDERIKAAYDQYVQNFPEIDEVKVRHILVEDKSKAKDLIKQLEEGADFAKLATENSTDGTAENGGEIDYFAEADVVPEFAKAAFGLEAGTYTKSPVKTEFGFHIIETQDKRKRPPASMEQAKPFLEAQLRQVALNEVVQEWRGKADLERYDINGDAIEPAAGESAK